MLSVTDLQVGNMRDNTHQTGQRVASHRPPARINTSYHRPVTRPWGQHHQYLLFWINHHQEIKKIKLSRLTFRSSLFRPVRSGPTPTPRQASILGIALVPDTPC